ncbi:alpha/beta hydrolase [Lactobacillus sp. YT155]|uniref:alpha/beta hydrolase n=1 Tax=Lactobacillus sp. YT155 TaxID=3060955 RepID=UPI00265DCBEB|nr:alpha/beta hydrolase [Lactobacillus sp. YT155]MDO1604849.1 alpha/beta hydrolase [Lactobacillus sp. YT155]
MSKVALYIHGQGGNVEEIKNFEPSLDGIEVIGLEYGEYLPWEVKQQFVDEFDKLSEKYDEVYLIANSLGAYLAMVSLTGKQIKQALLISPVLDMEKLILGVMENNEITTDQLEKEQEITMSTGEKILWDYLEFARNNPIVWDVSTEILYAGNDKITSLETVTSFAKKQKDVNVTIMEDGEHWFHTYAQWAFLNNWLKKVVKF